MSRKGNESHPPKWIEPQLTRLIDDAPDGLDWLHEIKYDGYRMHARIDGGDIRLLTRTGLDWSHRYKATISALRALPLQNGYLDGELCALQSDGVTSFSRLQAAMDEGRTSDLVFFVFDLLFLNGESTAGLSTFERKARLEALFTPDMAQLRFSEHIVGGGPKFREHACRLAVEADRPCLRIRKPRSLGQIEMPEPRRIRGRRLDRSDRQPSVHRLAASRLL
jgi:ATP-dependent DNA ligase